MKVAFIVELAGTKRQGGEQQAMLKLAEGLKKTGVQVDVYSYTDKSDRKIYSVIPLELRLLPFIRDIFFLPFIGRNLLKRIDTKYDLIHISSTSMAAFFKPSCKLMTTCHIIRSQKFETLRKIPKYTMFFNPMTYKVMSWLEKKSLRNSDRIIVIREHQKKFIQDSLGLPTNKIKIIPNGVDTQVFKPQSGKKQNQVIFVGRGTIPKGLDKLINASDKIKGNVLIVTQKIDPSLYHQAVQKKNVKIRFNASAQELSNLYSESRVFCLPSLDEEQPLTVFEAMACGLPVVVSKKAASDVVKNGINGFVLEDDKDLPSSINQLLDSDKNEKFRKENVDLIRSNYDFKSITNQTLDYYNDI